MTVPAQTTTLTEEAIQDFAVVWYQALDRHDPLADVLPMLVDDGLEMRFPEVTSYGHEGFASWYDAVTHRFFDEKHTVTSVDVTSLAPEGADVKVVVNWQCSIWDAPDRNSKWLGFNAYQTWRVVAAADGRPQIQIYVVDGMDPMEGSAPL